MPDSKRVQICDFCNMKIFPPKQVMYSTKTGYCICEDCVKMCSQGVLSAKKDNKVCFDDFDNEKEKKMKPKDIKAELDKYVIGQDDAKKAISVAVYNHYKMIENDSDVRIKKSNILLLGPTGSGKTLIAQTIANLLNVPFAIADCTSLTEAGYVGEDVENVLLKLYKAADGDVKRAETGIIFLDEVDKLAKANVGANLTKDPSGEGVQQSLLKIIEGTVANVPMHGGRKHPDAQYIEMNTENILFICGGAFPGIEQIVNKRTATVETSIGFGANVYREKEKALSDSLKSVQSEDLVKYGLIPEFIGRLPIVVSLDELDEEMMVDILTKPNGNIVSQYKEIFKYDDIELEFTEKALREIAKETIKNKTGARGLRGVIERVLKEYMFTLPSEDNVNKCIVKGLDDVEVTYHVEDIKKDVC